MCRNISLPPISNIRDDLQHHSHGASVDSTTASGASDHCTIYSLDVESSRNAAVYQLEVSIMIFDHQGKMAPSPRSRCTCPAGHLFCSQMLGLFLVFYVIQNPNPNPS